MAKPKIRFKGYTDDWEQRKLGDVLVSLQNNTLSRADLSNEAGVAKNVHYGDVLIKFGEVLDVSKEQLPMISDESILTKYKTSFLQNGDVIIADTAEDTTVGKCSEIVGLNDEVVLSGLHTIPYRPVEKFAPKYLGYYLNSDAYHNQLLPLMQGIKVTSISKSAMQDTDIIYPKSKEEQTEIGNYFDALDHLITLHQRKNIYFYEKVTLVWEQRKFSEFVKNVAVRNKAGVELECYAVTNDRGFISQKEAHDAFGYMADADTTAYNIVPPSSFAYNPARINVGSIGYYTGIENVIVSSLYEVFQTADYVDDRFMWHWFKSDHFSKWIERLQEGSVRLYFYYDKLIQCEMKMPSLEEQKKMGAFFDQLDHLITLHQCKCHLLHKLLHNDWEQRKLEDIMDTVTDYVAAGSFEDIRNNVTYLNEPGYAQLVRTVDLKKKFTNNDSIYVDESAFKYLWRVNLNEECIVLPNIGANIGEVYFVEPSGLPYDNNVLGPNAILLKANEDTYFAFTALNNLTFQKQLFENVGSSGQPKFNKTELKSIQLYMPQNEEQEKIGQYFRDLDHLITLHHRKYIYILKSP